jgi:hypothetical protein
VERQRDERDLLGGENRDYLATQSREVFFTGIAAGVGFPQDRTRTRAGLKEVRILQSPSCIKKSLRTPHDPRKGQSWP